jgi:DEAD/DEAH box helicase domain-containing protein
MANPSAFFEEPPEQALVNPFNDELLPNHVRCAARENWLKTDDEAYFGDDFPEVVAALEEAGDLERRSTQYGTRWTFDGDENPQMSTSLRTIEEHEIRLVDAARDDTIARLSLSDALRDAHPGEIYYHQGRTYEVADIDIDRGRAVLRETNATYYTRAIREKEITVETELDERVVDSHSGLPVTLAEATITQRIDRYMRYHGPDDDGEVVEIVEPLPETSLRTETLCFPIPSSVEEGIRSASEDEEGFIGALHALEHGMISLFPLKLLCDRRDIGGLSTALHPDTGRGTVFIHDGHPGGVGLARGGFDSIGELFEETRAMIAACPCESGCPSCVQSPHCGNANMALNKELAVELVSLLESTEQ